MQEIFAGAKTEEEVKKKKDKKDMSDRWLNDSQVAMLGKSEKDRPSQDWKQNP